MNKDRKFWTRDRIIEGLQEAADDDGYVTKSKLEGGLRRASELEYESWPAACAAAGVKARGRGRPKKS